MIPTTVVSRTVREIPFGIDKIDGSHAQRKAFVKQYISDYMPVIIYYFGKTNIRLLFYVK